MKAIIILAILATPLYADVNSEDQPVEMVTPPSQPQEKPVEQVAPETAPPQTIESDEGTTPVVEKEVSKLPEDARNKSTTNWSAIIMAASAVVIAVVALVLVGKNHGKNK